MAEKKYVTQLRASIGSIQWEAEKMSKVADADVINITALEASMKYLAVRMAMIEDCIFKGKLEALLNEQPGTGQETSTPAERIAG